MGSNRLKIKGKKYLSFSQIHYLTMLRDNHSFHILTKNHLLFILFSCSGQYVFFLRFRELLLHRIVDISLLKTTSSENKNKTFQSSTNTIFDCHSVNIRH